MKRKVTELEQNLIDDGWCLTTKRYTGKHSQKILCYEYHKTSDLRNDNKTYDLFIQLDQKRSQIVKYGIANLFVERMSSDELMIVRFLFLELRHYVERLTKENDDVIGTLLHTAKKLGEIADGFVPDIELDEKQELAPMTPEQFDELCKEKE